MPNRLRLYDCRISDLPQSVGLCNADIAGVANIVNSAQRRLLFCKEAGDESWIGTWAEVRFTMSRCDPFVTFDRSVARLELVDVCDTPVDVNNQFVEYLRFGNGRLPKLFAQGHCRCFAPAVYTRNNAPTFKDLFPPPQFIRAYFSDPADIGKRVLMQGLDNNNIPLNSQDGLYRVQGIYGNLTSPFFQWATLFNAITGIQKDQTNGQVQIFQVDPNTGAQVLLVTMQPSETVAWYRRYYFNNLPANCCNNVAPNPCNGNPCLTAPQLQFVTVSAIVKLEFIPVQADSDYCLIGNLEALKQECMAIRYSSMDSPQSKQLEAAKHKQAVGYLNGEISHVLGATKPAVNLAVFGDARLERQRIGSLL